jgi:hypothetical protein
VHGSLQPGREFVQAGGKQGTVRGVLHLDGADLLALAGIGRKMNGDDDLFGARVGGGQQERDCNYPQSFHVITS